MSSKSISIASGPAAITKLREKRKTRRARSACVACNQRKVRCDGAVLGAPCSNCRQDKLNCCMKERRGGRAHISKQAPVQESSDIQAIQLPERTWTFQERLVDSPCHELLDLSGLRNAPIEDLAFLKTKGCFHLPVAPRLRELLRHYFYSVHPYLPVVSEEDFGSLCTETTVEAKTRTTKHSLLVLQAMLFAASAFTPLSTLKAMGFQTYHAARNAFHHRAKLLYDFRIETNSMAISQAALLLSYHSTPTNPLNNSSWLAISIQHARAEGYHIYHHSELQSTRQISQKKKIWWSCIIRDRVIALGMRRSIQITLQHFDCGQQEAVEEDDFAKEIEDSEVYSAATKRLLIHEFIILCQLAVALTPSLLMVYPLNGKLPSTLSTKSEFLMKQIEIEECTTKLAKWKTDANLQSVTEGLNHTTSLETVVVYNDLTYLCYLSARIALCNYTVQMLVEHHHSFGIDLIQQLYVTKTELEGEIATVHGKMTRLMVTGFVDHLPISVFVFLCRFAIPIRIALVALPLALSQLDSRFSTGTLVKDTGQDGYSFYTEFLRRYGSRFEFADLITNIISHVVHLTGTSLVHNGYPLVSDSPNLLSYPRQNKGGWSELLVSHPRLYLQVQSFLDSSLSRGQLSPGTESSCCYPLTPSSPSLQKDTAIEIDSPEHTFSTDLCSELPELETSPQGEAATEHDSPLEESTPPQLQLRLESLSPAQAETPPAEGVHVFLPHIALGESWDDFIHSELRTQEEEKQKECLETNEIGDGNAEQIMDDLVSFMFTPNFCPVNGCL